MYQMFQNLAETISKKAKVGYSACVGTEQYMDSSYNTSQTGHRSSENTRISVSKKAYKGIIPWEWSGWSGKNLT
jgi:hypothetical protein